ncbi:MAG: ATP-dependent zinc metalloprotease FtsH [Candidatus Merdousia sp.]|nr:ATP-dependent zinc metalloprotease FtsH [Candidatus Merdousia sp.]
MDNRDKNSGFSKLPNKPYFVWLLIICAVVFLVSLPRGAGGGQTQELDVRKLMHAVENDTIASMTVRNDPTAGKDWYVIEGKIKNPTFGKEGADANTPRTLPFVFNGRITDEMYKKLSDPAAPWDLKEVPASTFWGSMVMSVLPFVIVVGFLYFFFMRQMRGAGKGAMSFGKSRARLLTPDKDRITFADVAGCDESKEEVSEIVEFLKNPQRFKDIGARIPKGILMVGPPGTGKTLLARAVAGEADVPFFSISGSDFVEMFVGVGAARVRDMFEQARKAAPCLVFIDEIDAVGRQRGAGLGGGNDEREQTLNSLLVEMDGFDARTGIIIIAATNRPDVLDNALLRPGRFDRQVVIDLPDVNGREEILKIHAKKIKLSDGVDLSKIARMTPGCSGADLANLLNESAIIAARRSEKTVSEADIDEARDKVFFGRERKKLMDADEKKLTAYHEAGHALIQAIVDNGRLPVHKVTIIPRGQSLGSTMFIPSRDIRTESKTSLLNNICTSLGGRVAEELVFSDITNGAAADIKQATKVARKMVCDWGMSDLGPISFGENQDHIFIGREIAREERVSERTAMEIDESVKAIIDGQLARARKIVSDNRGKLDTIANELLIRETIDGADVYKIVDGTFTPTDREQWECEQAEKLAAKRKAAANPDAERKPEAADGAETDASGASPEAAS